MGSKVKKVAKFSLLNSLIDIAERAEKSKLNEAFYEEMTVTLNKCAKILELDHEEIILLAVILGNSQSDGRRTCDQEDLYRFLGFNINRYRFHSEMKTLRKLKILGRKRDGFYVPEEVIEAFRKNKKFQGPSHKNVDPSYFFLLLKDLFVAIRDNECDQDELNDDLFDLLSDNKKLHFSQKALKLRKTIDAEEWLAFLYVCSEFINNHDEKIDVDEIEAVCEISSHALFLLTSNKSDLFEENLLRYPNDEGFVDNTSVCLTDLVKEDWLKEVDQAKNKSTVKKDLILSNSIKEKTLFYPQKESDQIEELTQLLQMTRFKEVQERLSEQGMRKGFACLFHGGPGTGKTETVYQMARQTGRDVMQVDIANAKSMWYGESQKIVKGIFERYQGYVKNLEKAPILLFNEADAIFGKRMKEADRAVEKTENAIQNIILEQIEKLDGILIATTNLATSLDSAFERRFIYKIEFSRPTLEARKSIWKSFFKDLKESEITELATKYDLSGGQIENIARRYTVHHILKGQKPDLSVMNEYAKAEQNGHSSEKKIGFIG